MLRIAVQSKGRLYDETMLLLEEAGIKLNRGKRILLLSAKGFPVEVLFLRDDDIPQSVANGVADVGIVGENEYVEKGSEAWLVKRLGFSKCRLSLAIPKDELYEGVQWFEGKTIATSYPEILKAYLKEHIFTLVGTLCDREGRSHRTSRRICLCPVSSPPAMAAG